MVDVLEQEARRVTWAKIIAGLVSFFNWLARHIERNEAKTDGRNEAELEARREADRVSDVVADAADRVRDDSWREIVDDPDNRRRRGRPL
jgi:hypothetical protein